jgi:hypothetical protein
MMRAAAIWLLAAAGGACKTRPDSSAMSAAAGDAAPDGGFACRDNAGCPPDQYCEFTPGLCGRGKRPGACRPKPATCGGGHSPVCGCDGKVYTSECAAYGAGVDLAVMGGCKERISDWAACGRQYCDVRTAYCAIYLSDVFELPTDYFCRPLPPSCLPADGAARACDCFPAGTPCLSFCGPMETGGLRGFHLTCMGVKPPLPDPRGD